MLSKGLPSCDDRFHLHGQSVWRATYYNDSAAGVLSRL